MKLLYMITPFYFARNKAVDNLPNESMRTHTTYKFVSCIAAALLTVSATAYGATLSLNVTVFDAGGKVVFQSLTKENASFTTRNLRPGNYVVRFNTTKTAPKEARYLLVLAAGEKKVIATDVPGEKIAAGGVAMRVAIARSAQITGQISEEPVMALTNTHVKVIAGKRYSWAQMETGSNLGGHWVEEGASAQRNIVRFSADEMRKIQDHAFEGSMLTRMAHSQRHPEGF